jgi:CubicO group peptidase (beta-lactamase class C family)
MTTPLSRVRLVAFAALALLLLVAFSALAPAMARADAVDDYIQAEMKKRHIPGLSLAVVKDGKIVKAKGYGLANMELQVPATADTVYQIGSVTKQFTATAIQMLIDEGKVALDDKISKYVDGTPDTWKDVTVRHLLTHTSGIKSYTGLPDFQKITVLPTTKEDLVKLMAGHPLEFAPGEKWAYNNTGYFLLGMVIEKASGKSYGDFLQERIFTPLAMTATRVNDEKAIIPNRASGYHWDKGTLRNADAISMTWPYAAGVIVSTVTDLAKWDAALYTDKLLKKSSRDAMWTPVKLNDGKTSDYGFGWSVGKVREHRNISHGGGIPGFSTFLSRFPDDGWTVIVLTNQDNGANPGGIAQGVAGRYVAALAPVVVPPIEDKEPQVTALVKSVYEQAAQGKLDAARFTPELAQIGETQLKQGLKEFLQNLGPLQSIALVERKDEGENRLYRYRLAYKDTSLLTLCTLNKEGKIAGLSVQPE